MIIFICIVQYVKEKLCRERKECCTQKNSLTENNGKEISIQIIFILDDQRKEMSSLPIKFFTLPPEACNPTSWIHYKFTPSNFPSSTYSSISKKQKTQSKNGQKT